MSYINDALQKAQKEKQSPYTAYEPILAVPRKKAGRSKRLLALAGISIFLIWALVTVVLFARPGEKKIARATVTPLKASSAQTIAPMTQNVPPAPAAVLTEINKPSVKETKKISPETAVPERAVPKTAVDDPETLYAQAFKKHQEGNLEEAKKLYKKVIKADPRNIQALNNLGVVYMKKGVYKWAVIRFNDALKIKYNFADAHYNLACVYAQQKDTGRSLFYLRKAIDFNPQVKKWAENDNDLKVLADLPEYKKLLEKK